MATQVLKDDSPYVFARQSDEGGRKSYLQLDVKPRFSSDLLDFITPLSDITEETPFLGILGQFSWPENFTFPLPS